MLYTIRNERTSRVRDVTLDEWTEIQTRSRGWKKVGEIEDKPVKKEKAAKQKDVSEREEALPEWTGESDILEAD